MASGVVAELVEIPLAVPFDEFLRRHNSAFLPVLLKQPGIISVKTGEKLNDSSEPSAVSFTLWRSLEDHERFTNSPAAGPFFEKLAPFTTGPPTIGHYRFSVNAEAHARLPFTDFRKYKAKVPGASDRGALAAWSVERGGHNTVAACLEDRALITAALFGESIESVRRRKVGTPDIVDLLGSFTVQWASFGAAKTENSLL
ncbi:hypothetical protein B0J12DRAFT_78772 [Macrophomina phaseolina]|uniref:ABM domain-containing protein n=1 Tax=Macrophomina phaseolina TaxID=35725 RepID=A0ABQ8GEJ3_9PEZI|nr:hypothetical protein B0J12DRAFT_78772 [Macrophomina phaseolina]